MSTLPIEYREFYDLPRAFLVRNGGQCFFFSCRFEDAIDEYASDYSIYLMPDLGPEDISGSWDDLEQRAVRFIGKIPVAVVVFDPTKRRSIDETAFDLIRP